MYCTIPLIGHFGKGKTIEMKFKSVAARGWSYGQRVPTKEYEGTFWDDRNTLSQLWWRVHIIEVCPNT